MTKIERNFIDSFHTESSAMTAMLMASERLAKEEKLHKTGKGQKLPHCWHGGYFEHSENIPHDEQWEYQRCCWCGLTRTVKYKGIQYGEMQGHGGYAPHKIIDEGTIYKIEKWNHGMGKGEFTKECKGDRG